MGSFTFAVLVVYLLNGKPEVEIYRVKDETACWTIVGESAKSTSIPDNATITCIPLRNEKAT